MLSYESYQLAKPPKMRLHSMKENDIRNEYDFSKSTKNPYIKRLKKSITIRLEPETVNYFKSLSQESGIPYQTLINLFLSQCAKEKKKPEVVWQ